MIYVLSPDGAPAVYALPPKQSPPLALLYSLIQTDTVEVVLDDGKYQFVVDENGLAMGKAPNIRATALWYSKLGFPDAADAFLMTNEGLSSVLVGTVVVLTDGNRLK